MFVLSDLVIVKHTLHLILSSDLDTFIFIIRRIGYIEAHITFGALKVVIVGVAVVSVIAVIAVIAVIDVCRPCPLNDV